MLGMKAAAVWSCFVFLAGGLAAQPASSVPQDRLVKEVRHVLVMLPYYGVFDNLAFSVEDSTVTLTGQVTRPALKSDADNAVKKIEGVQKVVNRIEVLPLSPNDDRIRRDVYRAIYSQPSLETYAIRAVPPIHIIVKNANVTLEGAVATTGDKDLAGIQTKGAAGVSGVTNNLVVAK
jgi:hyperosmotically inducible protein